MSIKFTEIKQCKVCGSDSLTWDTSNISTSGVPQGRLNTRDVQCVFFLGCDNCSETLVTVNADKVATLLNDQRGRNKPLAETQSSS